MIVSTYPFKKNKKGNWTTQYSYDEVINTDDIIDKCYQLMCKRSATQQNNEIVSSNNNESNNNESINDQSISHVESFEPTNSIIVDIENN